MSETVVIELPQRMDIASAEATHLQFENVLEQGQGIELEGAGVVRLDTAGVQLLTCLFAEANNHHLDICWRDVSNTIVETFTFLNLKQVVGLEGHAGASE